MMASNAVSGDQARFIYLGMAILDSFTNISRDLVSREISSTDIKREISKCATFPKINTNQKMLVDNAAIDGYKNFDVSLLYVLLRNVCLKITPPTKGWGNVHKLPNPREITVGDDIERIRIIRNEVYGHVASASVPQSDFNRYWQIISDVCHRMDRELGRGSKYEADLNSIRTKYLDPDLLKKYREELNTNYQKDSLTAQALWDIQERLDQNKPATEHQIEISGDSEVKHGENVFLSAIIPSHWQETELTWQKVDARGSRIINLQDQKYRGSLCHSRMPRLVINHVDSNDSGIYQIEVSHQEGRQTSQKMNICVLGDPPKVDISTPQQHGQSIIIPCNISEASPTVSLKWTKDDKELDVSSSNGKFSGGTTNNPSLTIQDVNTDDVGDYQCVVTNAYGTTSTNRIRLEKPCIELREVKQLENNLRISCCVTTNDSPSISKMEWKKDGFNLKSENENKYQFSSDDDVSLTIFDVDISDQGQYQFSAMNLLGSSECKIFIDVSSFIYYRHKGESYFEHGDEDRFLWMDLEILQETENEFRCKPVVSKVIKEQIPTESDEEVQKILDGHQIICFGLLLQEQFIISSGSWYHTLECISKHMGTTIKTENRYREVMTGLECRYLLRNNGVLKFASEQAERETLWAFLKNQGKLISNTEFLLKNTTDSFHIAKHFRTQGYSRKEGELFISLPHVLTESFVKKLGIDVLDHPTIEDSSIYQIVSDELKIPKEVFQWGKEGQGRYINYLRSERIEVYSARGMILGCAGSGKTTLLHRLRNDGMDKIKKITSTRGLEVHNDVFVVNNEATDLEANKENTRNHLKVPMEYITGQKRFEHKTRFGYKPPLSDDDNNASSTRNISASASASPEVDKNASSTLNMNATAKDESVRKTTLGTGEKMSFIRRFLNRLRQPKGKQVQHKQTTKNQENIDDNIKEPKEEHVPDKVNRAEFDFKRVLNQCFENICTQEEDIPKTLSFMDFAGQSGYYACHHTFLNSRAFFILVLNMKIGFDGVVEINTEDDDPFLPDRDHTFFYKWKQRDFFIFWLKSIHIHCGKNARVLVVVTHAEESSKMDEDRFREDLLDTAKNQEENISVHIEKKVFFIGFPKTRGEELKDISVIRQYIAAMVKAQDSWGQLVPAYWVLFEEILQNMKRENKMLKFSQIQAIAKDMPEIEMNDEQVSDMLNFFNDLGVILFFQEESLKENIIIDIQWFIDAFKNVITDPEHAKEDLLSECINEWKEFNTTGILGEDLLEFIWKHSKDESQSFLKYRKDIIAFMIRLGMMTDIETDERKKCWYVPCVNRKPFRKDLFDKDKKSSSILCFLFDTLPDILFFKLVAKCSEFWKFSFENNEKCIFHTAAIFFYGNNAIIVSKTKRLITVQVIFVGEDSTIGAEIRKKIKYTLCLLIKAFKYTLNYDVGYICDKKYSYSEDSCHHVILESTIKDKKGLTCPLCPITQRHTINCREFTFWKETDERVVVKEGMSYVEYQTHMASLAKKIAMTSQEMVLKAGVSPADLGMLAKQLTRDYDQLAGNSASAAATSTNPDIANRIRTTVQDLGRSCVELVQDAGNVQGNPSDTFARRDLQDHARSVNVKVGFVLATLQAGSRGTQACINAASTVSGIIADLDTTIMFATAGTLNTEGDESFASHREDILKTAKALVEETKRLVQGAASDQETLAGAAQQAVKTITKLADVVKLGAASLGSNQPEAQVLIINAVKDVASALSDLISATKNASGKNVSDPAMLTLKESAKVMVTNVTSLLKTVKTVEDEAARGTRALESTIEAIGQEIKAYEAGTLPEKKASAEDLIRLTKPITTATAKAVAAGNSCRQDDVISCANMGRKAIFDLLATCRGAASTAETTDIRQKTIQSGKTCAKAYKDLLEQVNVVVQKPSVEAKQNLAVISRQVPTSVTEIVHCAEAIKGTDWVDPEDPTVIAESELLGAANSIEAAAKKLAQLKPRKKAKQSDREDVDSGSSPYKSTEFRKSNLHTQDMILVDMKSTVSNSVGKIIIENGNSGTGFRVGDNYIMTNFHIIRDNAERSVDGFKLKDRAIVRFQEKKFEQTIVPQNEFSVLPVVPYFNRALDVAVLQLKTHSFHDVAFPQALTVFGNINYDNDICFMGHPGGIQMKEDTVKPIRRDNETNLLIKRLEDYSVKNLPPGDINYYQELNDKTRVIFNTAFTQGSSGSPGIQFTQYKPCVVTIMSGGMPSCFYEGIYVPTDKTLEVGIIMEDIQEDMYHNNPALAANIFKEWVKIEKKNYMRIYVMFPITIS